MKEFNIRAKDGSKTSSQAFRDLGMDADAMAQTFARGGPAAQEAFANVVQAISAIEDPVKKNEVGIALMGTQFEDLEADVVAAMGTVKQQFDMTKDSMESLEKVKYDNLTGALKGIGRNVQTHLLIPFGNKILPVVQKVANGIVKYIPSIQSAFKSMGDRASSVWETFKKFGSGVVKAFTPIAQTIVNNVMPIISDAVKFFTSIMNQVKDFWSANGGQIMQATKNVFGFISNVFHTVFPVVLAVVESVWNNIKGVIQGAFTVITSAIKIFSSLFTGDWKGVWDGVVGLIKGAIQVVWNVWNLLLVGRLIKGAKLLVKGVIGFFKGMGTKLVTNVQYYYQLFKDGFKRIGTNILTTIGNVMSRMVGFVKGAITRFITIFQTARAFGVNVFHSIFLAVKGVFTTVWNFLKTGMSTVISAVVTRISGFVTTVKDFITRIWTNVVEIFEKIKVAMITPFQTVRSVIVDLVEKTKNTVKGLFESVKNFGKGAINGLIAAANGLIGGINSLNINVPDWVPQVGGKAIGFNIPQIPMLAKGGITTGPTLAMIGEGREQEAVLPLSKLQNLLNSGGGSQQGAAAPLQITVHNVFNVQNGTNTSALEHQINKSNDDLFRKIEEFTNQKNRLNFAR